MDEFREKWPEMRMKHLELIQSALGRMGANCTSLKGHCITIIGAVIALAAAVHKAEILLYCLPVIVGISILDGAYLSLEKGFRQHYNYVRTCALDCQPDFEIVPTYGSYVESYLSWSVAGFYGCAVLVMIVIFLAM